MKSYVNVVVRHGRSYNYFRPPQWAQTLGVTAARLPDDPAAARLVAQQLMERAREERRLRDADKGLGHLKRAFGNARSRARRRAMAFDLDIDFLRQMLIDQGMRCAVTGKPFQFAKRDGTRFAKPFAPSIDRIDCAQGYTRGNVRLVCCAANMAMGEWGESALQELANALSERHKNASPTAYAKRSAKRLV